MLPHGMEIAGTYSQRELRGARTAAASHVARRMWMPARYTLTVSDCVDFCKM